MNGSLGTVLPSSVPSSLSSAVTSPEVERRCALFSVGDEHAALSRAASPAPIKVLLSTLVGSCPLPGLLWWAEAGAVMIERVSLVTDQAWAAQSKPGRERTSTRVDSSHGSISYAVVCVKQRRAG